MNKKLRNELILILAGGGLLVGLVSANVQGLPAPLAILRFTFGLVYILFIPGYLLQAALFPLVTDLDGTERVALSFALSLVVLSPIALLLDRLPWGIRVWPIVISLCIFIVVCTAAGMWRRLLLPAAERFDITLGIDLKGWWAMQERGNRVVYMVLVVTLATVFLTALSIFILPRPAQRFTEFYILGSQGLAQDYPIEVAVDETVIATVGITNQEGIASAYRIQVKSGNRVLTQEGPVVLDYDKTWEHALEFAIPVAGDDQQILFVLERDGQPSPYRTLRLWINVKPTVAP
jgi:uncharacterized membrane protein